MMAGHSTDPLVVYETKILQFGMQISQEPELSAVLKDYLCPKWNGTALKN